MIESDSRTWMSKDQQKGEKFNKGHFVVEQIKIDVDFLLTPSYAT